MQDVKAPFTINWQGNEIGSFTVINVDHQYWEGLFVPNSSSAAVAFQKLARSFNVPDVYNDWRKGTKIELLSLEGSQMHCMVFGLVEQNTLVVRFVYHTEALEWLNEHVG